MSHVQSKSKKGKDCYYKKGTNSICADMPLDLQLLGRERNSFMDDQISYYIQKDCISSEGMIYQNGFIANINISIDTTSVVLSM